MKNILKRLQVSNKKEKEEEEIEGVAGLLVMCNGGEFIMGW